MIQIIPAVLPTSEQQFKDDMRKLASSETLEGGWVHIDFMDGDFVPNKSIDPQVIEKLPDNFQKEAHLMVLHPKEWIEKLVNAGFKRIIFHVECRDDVDEVIDMIKTNGLEVGLAVKNNTYIEQLEPFIDKIDVALLMSIVAGFQGQPFIPSSLNKIKRFKSKRWSVKVGVDGAVKDNNIREIVDAGVDFVIVGSYLLNGDVDDNMEKLWEEADV